MLSECGYLWLHRLELDLDDATRDVCDAARDLRRACGDVLAYGGEAYATKCKEDRTRLLFNLESERLRDTPAGVNANELMRSR